MEGIFLFGPLWGWVGPGLGPAWTAKGAELLIGEIAGACGLGQGREAIVALATPPGIGAIGQPGGIVILVVFLLFL